MSRERKRGLALLLCAGLVAVLVGVGVASGYGSPDVKEGYVAVVDETQIGTAEEIDSAMRLVAAQQAQSGKVKVPKPGDPTYDQTISQAVANLVDEEWVRAEAAERGVEATQSELDREREQVIGNFGSRKKFERFLERGQLSVEDADARIELGILSRKIQEQVLEGVNKVDGGEIAEYYGDNVEQFSQPASRNLRMIKTKRQQQADQVLAELAKDSSPKAWERLARRSSIDEATKNAGGVRENFTEGVDEAEFSKAVFAGSKNQITGPVKTATGYYVFEVTAIREAGPTPLKEVEQQISQTLANQRRNEAFNAFLQAYRDRWQNVTVCAEGFELDRCSNAKPVPAPEGAPPVASRTVLGPGAQPGVAQPVPQGPHPPGGDAPAAGIPGLGGGVPGGGAPVPVPVPAQ